MSKNKAKKNSERGTYALCITTGLIVLGLGLGPLLGMLASSAVGVLTGGVAAYLINNRKSRR